MLGWHNELCFLPILIFTFTINYISNDIGRLLDFYGELRLKSCKENEIEKSQLESRM